MPEEDGQRDPEVLLGTISIPALDIEQPILQGIKLKTFDYGVGHWPGTAMPGKVGNVVLGGHRTKGIRPFFRIDQLEKGDEIIVKTDDGTFVYRVQHQEIVDGEVGRWIVTQSDSARLTLFACHPPGSTAQRIVIFAQYDRKVVEEA
jgi:sortase A